MDLGLILKVILLRRQLRKRESWHADEVKDFQAKRLGQLREFAYAHSPFYKVFHKNLMSAPLEDLPILTKKILMENFDVLTTDRMMSLQEVRSHIETMTLKSLLHNEYRVTTTAGTTGARGVFVHNKEEWENIIASYSRANEWAGLKVDLLHRMKMAVVSSTVPWHQSARVGASVSSPWVNTLRLDAADPLDSLVTKLNQFQPENLVGYANMGKTLAVEQIKGSLKISPRAVMCASEVLTTETRNLIKRAWNCDPFNVYGATETAGIAAECSEHRGLHIFEDLVITEVVDDQNKPVPAGTPGEKILVTVLWSRTLPLIRYEMTDSCSRSLAQCRCGRPFRMLSQVEGRQEDSLHFQSKDRNMVTIHPNVFHEVLEPISAAAWQVVQTTPMGLEIKLAGSNLNRSQQEEVLRALTVRLTEKGAVGIAVKIVEVREIPKTAIGKTKLILKAPV